MSGERNYIASPFTIFSRPVRSLKFYSVQNGCFFTFGFIITHLVFIYFVEEKLWQGPLRPKEESVEMLCPEFSHASPGLSSGMAWRGMA